MVHATCTGRRRRGRIAHAVGERSRRALEALVGGGVEQASVASPAATASGLPDSVPAW